MYGTEKDAAFNILLENEFLKMLENFSPKNIYNAEHTFVFKNE